MTVNTIALIDVDGELVEIWAIPFWRDENEQAVRVLRTAEYTDRKFIVLISQNYYDKLRDEGNQPKFIAMMKALAGDMVKEDWKKPDS